MKISINPNLPKHFYSTENSRRSKTQLKRWWCNPFVIGYEVEEYSVWCLDGGAWDRPTFHAQYENIDDAIQHAKTLKETLSEQRFKGGRYETI